MKKMSAFFLAGLFLLSLACSPVFGQDAAGILKKMIEAQGGKKALEAIKDTTVTGTIELIQMGLSGTMTIYQKEPNKMRWDMELMGMVITQASDGETAWMTNPQTGSIEVMPEGLAEDFKRGALGNDSLLNPEKYGITFTYKGKENIEGKDYFVLEQTYSDGHKATQYIDSGTYLTYKSKTTGLNQMSGGEVEIETFLSDYRKVDGTMVPYLMRILQEGTEFMKMTFTKVSLNPGLEDSLFKMK
jgi:outer membrane lipoprotein-sorting protein